MKYGILGVAAATLLLAGCSGNPLKGETTKIEQSVDGTDTVPTWYIEPQTDTDATIYAAATGLSDDLQFSIDKAMHQAKVLLGDKLAATTSAEVKRFVGDNGTGGLSQTSQQTQQVSKSGFKNVNVSSYTVDKKAVAKEGVFYRTYILLRLDVNDAPTPNTFSEEDRAKADEALNNL